MRFPRLATATLAASLAAATAHADEGLWTFDNPPSELVRQRYGVALDPAVLRHLQAASVHFDASAAFVSGRGLLLTNHHAALDCIDQLSSARRDIGTHGHLARRPAEELRCPGGVARVLLSTEDVTAQVQQAMAGAGSDEHRNALRKATIAKLESACTATATTSTGGKAPQERCEVVSLYSATATGSANGTTCAWSSPPNTRPASTAATPTTSSTPASRSTSRCCVSTRTASR